MAAESAQNDDAENMVAARVLEQGDNKQALQHKSQKLPVAP